MSGQLFFFDQLLRDQTSGDQLLGGQTFMRSISGRSNVRSMIKKESLLFRYLSHFEFLVHSHSRIKVVIFSYLQYQFSDYHKQRKVTGFCLLVLNQSLLTIIKYPIKIDSLTSKKVVFES